MNKRKIILAGGSGFLGQVLARWFLASGNHDVVTLTRSPKAATTGVRQIYWDGCTIGPWAGELEHAHALINLAGVSVNCRYHSRNRLILDSRIDSTRVLGEAVARCSYPPPVWLNAGTATIYKHTFGPPWDESGEVGGTVKAKDIFSVQVATAWEKTFNEAETPRTRKVLLRSAMVLGLGGNSVFPVLRRMTHLGLGGCVASGRQHVSWIHEIDFCRAIEWLIDHDDFSGVVNLAAPNPLTNRDMMRTLRRVCGVPLGFPAPRLLLEMGAFFLRTETELVIKSRRVIPGRLARAGFQFRYPFVREAFEDLNEK